MSDDDDELPLVLSCEECFAEFQPQQFGAATIADVPQDARCLRCGGLLFEADPN